MSFQQHHARYSRLRRESAAWHLLRSDNAANTLAFIADLFNDETEIPFARARAALDAELVDGRDAGLWHGEVVASVYLRQWIQSGWLRELDDKLSKTDACEIALRFVERLDQRETHATASHLRIVQDAARDLALALTTNPDERLSGLERQRAEIQRQIDDVASGVLIRISEQEQRERIRELYQLAAVLTGDFRHLEDEIRELDQSLRVHMIDSSNRGDVLTTLLDEENVLSMSDAGRAFEGFFELLMDRDRSTELREQLRQILSSDTARHLTPKQARYLNQLMRELSRESDRVLTVRRRAEENLRLYIEHGVHLERRVVDQLIGRLENLAVQLRESERPLTTDLNLVLDSGRARFSTVSRWELYSPDSQLSSEVPIEHANSREAGVEVLAHLEMVNIEIIAQNIVAALEANGPQSVAQLVESCANGDGLEELVAFIRVAVAVNATELPSREMVCLDNSDGSTLRASIPHYLLNAQMFPDSFEELGL